MAAIVLTSNTLGQLVPSQTELKNNLLYNSQSSIDVFCVPSSLMIMPMQRVLEPAVWFPVPCSTIHISHEPSLAVHTMRG